MKKKVCISSFIALLLLIFLVVLFPYKEGFEFKTIFNRDISGSMYGIPSLLTYKKFPDTSNNII
jgi:hypothetical protein